MKLMPQLWHWITIIWFIVWGRDMLKQEKLNYAGKFESDLSKKEIIKRKRLLFWGRTLFWMGIFFLAIFSAIEFTSS